MNTESTNISLSQADELRKFKDLLDEGIISQEEFEKKKEQLLKADSSSKVEHNYIAYEPSKLFPYIATIGPLIAIIWVIYVTIKHFF
ncbi:MAG: SHOCT domain-containing protein [Oscillospiraceae bacterium]|nr:SHOCT domain-containing protein [Oscillospiraceae bacterium]